MRGLEKSIVFSGPEVRAILAGRKTQFRLPVKPQPQPHNGMVNGEYCGKPESWFPTGTFTPQNPSREYKPPYPVGTLLWVKEAWAKGVMGAIYKANCGNQINDECWEHISKPGHYIDVHKDGWRPSIHMPHWASRITLRVTDVRVQRLREIDEPNAKNEGAYEWAETRLSSERGLNKWCRRCKWNARQEGRDVPGAVTVRDAYSLMWDAKHGKRYPWDSNPWIWAYTFEATTKK